MKIGFIGLGIMGSRMAANLQKNGHLLMLFNRTPAKAKSLVVPSGTFAESPGKLGAQVDVLFTMLSHPDADWKLLTEMLADSSNCRATAPNSRSLASARTHPKEGIAFVSSVAPQNPTHAPWQPHEDPHSV